MTEQSRELPTREGAWRSLWRPAAGRLPGIWWGLSLLVPLALILWILSLLLAPDDPGLMTIRAESQVTGESIVGATILIDGVRYRTDDSGQIRIHPVQEGTDVVVSAPGHETMRDVVDESIPGEKVFSLTGVLVLGSVRDALSGAPVEGAELTVVDAEGTPVASTRTDQMGGFVFTLIPEDAVIHVKHDLYGVLEQPIDVRRSLSVNLDPPPVSGRVVNPDGQPVEGALVTGAKVRIETGVDGRFTLDPIGQGSEVRIVAEGTGETRLAVEGHDLGDIEVLPGPATPAPLAGSGQ